MMYTDHVDHNSKIGELFNVALNKRTKNFMAYFFWSDKLSVGNRFIDADHRILIDIINKLHDAMQEGKGKEIVDQVLFDLLVYTKGHFRREEDQMNAINFSGLKEHKLAHEFFLQQLDAFRHDIQEDESTLTIQVAEFLRTWLMNHIMTSDMALGAAIRAAG